MLLAAVMLFSAWKLLSILAEYQKGQDSYEALARKYTTKTPIQSAAPAGDAPIAPFGTTTIEPETAAEAVTTGIFVDFDTLAEDCPDVVGWLYCPDTPLQYPVVQGADNDYYLRRLLDGTWNINGSIFLDYRCPADFSGWNHILYGHNMKNDTMFGSLEKYRDQAYYDAHPFLYLLTPTRDYRIDLIAGYVTAGNDAVTYTLPESAEERDLFLENARQSSTFLAEADMNGEARLITFSTCVYDFENARYVLTGILRDMDSLVEGDDRS